MRQRDLSAVQVLQFYRYECVRAVASSRCSGKHWLAGAVWFIHNIFCNASWNLGGGGCT